MLTAHFDSVANWVSEKLGQPIPSFGGSAIGWVSDNKLTCGALYEHYTGPCITASIVVEGTYIPKEFLSVIFEYPFRQLGCNKILATVELANQASCKMLLKMGFIEVARIDGVFPSGAMVIFEMSRHNCRFLESENGQEV